MRCFCSRQPSSSETSFCFICVPCARVCFVLAPFWSRRFSNSMFVAVAIFVWLRSHHYNNPNKISFSGFFFPDTTELFPLQSNLDLFIRSTDNNVQCTQTIRKQNSFSVISWRWPLFGCQLFDFCTNKILFLHLRFGDNSKKLCVTAHLIRLLPDCLVTSPTQVDSIVFRTAFWPIVGLSATVFPTMDLSIRFGPQLFSNPL